VEGLSSFASNASHVSELFPWRSWRFNPSRPASWSVGGRGGSLLAGFLTPVRQSCARGFSLRSPLTQVVLFC
jgi:hypothetical protein